MFHLCIVEEDAREVIECSDGAILFVGDELVFFLNLFNELSGCNRFPSFCLIFGMLLLCGKNLTVFVIWSALFFW